MTANILPDGIEIQGTLRGFDPVLHQRLKDGIEKILASVARKFSAETMLEYKNGYPMLVNTGKETDFAISVARETVGAEKVIASVPRTLGVEDFAEFLKRKPGNFMALGTGRTDGMASADIHNCKYDFNDAALPVGARYWVNLVRKALPLKGIGAQGSSSSPTASGPPPRL
jgi:metal-dependent amidase/aminoacylase/carboxypeptidase family protein